MLKHLSSLKTLQFTNVKFDLIRYLLTFLGHLSVTASLSRFCEISTV